MDFAFSKEQLMFKKEVIRFAKQEIVPRVQEYDRREAFDFEAFRKLGEFGILGLHFPEKYGGEGADVVTTVIAGEALGAAGVDGGLTLSYGAHSFLCADTLLCHASEAQKQRYLPGLATGELIGCMALSEPDAGSDVASMTATAVKQGDAYILNGTKMWITNGPIADVAVVYAKTDPGAQHAGISAFVVERGTPGFTAGNPLIKMGVRTSQTSELVFSNCAVPVENRLGNEGDGFLMAMQTVEWDRSAILAPFVGTADYLLTKCAAYAKGRVQFGRPIGHFQAIKHKLADIRIFGEAAKALVYRVAWYKDQGRPLNHLEAAIAKLYIGDHSLGPTNDAVVLHGGYGFTHEFDVERIFRDSRLAPIGGGTSEIQKKIISKLM